MCGARSKLEIFGLQLGRSIDDVDALKGETRVTGHGQTSLFSITPASGGAKNVKQNAPKVILLTITTETQQSSLTSLAITRQEAR